MAERKSSVNKKNWSRVSAKDAANKPSIQKRAQKPNDYGTPFER